ncbi:MAG: IS200/IS605 family transposase [Bacteroidota bacterium]
MSHSLTKIWLHVVFGTKLRRPFIDENLEEKLYVHLRDQLEQDFGCTVRSLGGMADHVHILFQLNPNFAVKDIVKNIKGESSHWVNQKNLTMSNFVWQTGYGAFSVSESKIEVVESYIRNQKQHHKRKTFVEEYEEFIKKHGLSFHAETAEVVDFRGGKDFLDTNSRR